jgi:hypothetical protein
MVKEQSNHCTVLWVLHHVEKIKIPATFPGRGGTIVSYFKVDPERLRNEYEPMRAPEES